jgi:hypothetical protein
VFIETRGEVDEAEIAITKGGEFFKGDDYLCMVKASGDSNVYISGSTPASPVLNFLKAMQVQKIYVPFPRSGKVNIIRGTLPYNCPPGSYLLCEPEGRISSMVFSKTASEIKGKMRVSQNTEFTQYCTFPSELEITLNSKAGNSGLTFLEAGGKPAAGYFKDKGYSIVYLLFNIDKAVMMQNVMRFFVVGGRKSGKLRSGERVDLPPGQYDIIKKGKSAWQFTVKNESIAVKETGVYRKGRVSLFGVNSETSYEDLLGERSLQTYGNIADDDTVSSKDLYIWLFAGIITLLSLLVLVER